MNVGVRKAGFVPIRRKGFTTCPLAFLAHWRFQNFAIAPEAAGLQAIAHGFAALCADDHYKLALEFPMHDALFAWCQTTVGGEHG